MSLDEVVFVEAKLYQRSEKYPVEATAKYINKYISIPLNEIDDIDITLNKVNDREYLRILYRTKTSGGIINEA